MHSASHACSHTSIDNTSDTAGLVNGHAYTQPETYMQSYALAGSQPGMQQYIPTTMHSYMIAHTHAFIHDDRRNTQPSTTSNRHVYFNTASHIYMSNHTVTCTCIHTLIHGVRQTYAHTGILSASNANPAIIVCPRPGWHNCMRTCKSDR